MKTSINNYRQYHPALDGLRGVGVLLIVLFHNFEYTGLFTYGWLGVDLFFVLSGYLITNILLQEKSRKNVIIKFYARRILRIFPLYYLTLLIFLFLLSRHQNLHWYFIFAQNWLMGFRFNETPPQLHHLWSLAVEEQYYFIWPFFVIYIKQKRDLVLLLLAALIILNLIRFGLLLQRIDDFPYTFLFTFNRFDGLIVGSLLALTIKSITSAFTFRTVIVVLIINFLFSAIFPERFGTLPYYAYIGYTSIALLFAALIYILLSDRNSIIKRIMENRILVILGKVSFGLYVFHHPIHQMLSVVLLSKNTTLFGQYHALLITAIETTIGAILISLLSYYFFEQYFLKFKKKFS